MPALTDPFATFVMWAGMMAVMMLPAALPPILRRDVWFAAGYLGVWTAFSGAATLVQWQCANVGLLSPALALRSVSLAALVVAGVGLYQFTPVKRACLACCRAGNMAPAGSLRATWLHAVVAGLRYGCACLGCCWAIMTLMFVVGVTSIGWMAAIAAFVMLERLGRRGVILSRLAGIICIACGTVIGVHASP